MSKYKIGLTNNQLKIIAMIAMLIDHIGAYLLPQYAILRIIGRLSFPIFAYMIAEGCRYTRNRTKYLGMMFGAAVIMQAVYFIITGSMYSTIFMTFSLSIGTIYCIDLFLEKRNFQTGLLAVLVLITVVFLCVILPKLNFSDFWISYGVFGVLLPVAVYYAPNKPIKLLIAGLMLSALAFTQSTVQWYGLLTLPLLALYNSQRGKANLKYVFYIFYPAHLTLLYFIKILIEHQ